MFPADVYVLMPFTIDSVVMKHVNGVYSHREWHSTKETLSEDWRAIITDTIARSQAVRSKAEGRAEKIPKHKVTSEHPPLGEPELPRR